MMRNLAVVCFVFLGLGGCAFTPKELDLYATPDISTQNIGNDTKVYFRFLDDRDDMTIGVRAAANSGSKITAANLDHYVEEKLRDGLRTKGYVLVEDKSEAEAEITYRLRAFKFSLNTGFWTGAENKSAIIGVDAERGPKDYSTHYRFEDEDRALFIPGGKEIDREMNYALEVVLTKALNDYNLDNLLTGK